MAFANSGEHEAWRLRRSCAPAASPKVNGYAFASSHYLQSLCASAPLRWRKIRGKQFARICSNNKQKYFLLLLNEIVVYCYLLFSDKWFMELWSLWPLGACDASSSKASMKNLCQRRLVFWYACCETAVKNHFTSVQKTVRKPTKSINHRVIYRNHGVVCKNRSVVLINQSVV